MFRLFENEEVIVLRSSIESHRRLIKRALTDMKAAMSKTHDNLKSNNAFAAKNEMEAVIDLSKLLAQAVQEILATVDQLEELYDLQMKTAQTQTKSSKTS